MKTGKQRKHDRNHKSTRGQDADEWYRRRQKMPRRRKR